jgi:site-specific DNA recombinase
MMRAVEQRVDVAGATPRAVLYLRQSTYREESISLELQEEIARAYCERQGYKVVAVEADPGISGRTWARPAVQRVMSMLEQRRAERVILWKWSRLSRDDYDWAVARRIASTAGGRIESASEPNPEDSPEGRLMLSQMISFAVYESDRIGAVWKDVHRHRRQAGVPAQGGDRYGYVRDGDTFTPDPTTGPILATMYRRYIDGDGFTRIVAWLNGSGLRTRTGAEWSRSTLTALLDSGFGAGLIIHGKRKHAEYHPGAHPGVIEPDEWDAYRRRRAEAPEPSRTAEPRYFLSGLVKCGDCGAPMHSSSSGGARIGYTCSRWARTKTGRCVTANRPRVERFVRAWLDDLAADVERQAAIAAKDADRQVAAVEDASAIERRIAALNVKLAALTTRYLDGKVPDAAYAATSARLQDDHDSLTDRLSRAHRRQHATVDLSDLSPAMALWDRATVAEQRRVVRALVAEVRIIPPAEIRRGGPTRVRFEIIPTFSD